MDDFLASSRRLGCTLLTASGKISISRVLLLVHAPLGIRDLHDDDITRLVAGLLRVLLERFL